jgi:hypothetical protein
MLVFLLDYKKGVKKIDNSSWIGVGYNIVYGNPVIAREIS